MMVISNSGSYECLSTWNEWSPHLLCCRNFGDNDLKPRSSAARDKVSRAASPQLTLYLANAHLGSPVPVANKSQTDSPPPLSPDEIVSLERGK